MKGSVFLAFARVTPQQIFGQYLPIGVIILGERFRGEMVSVTSPQGVTKIRVWVTNDIMAEVICLQEGIWPIIDEKGVDLSGSVNLLTSMTPTQPSQASRTHSVAVQVDKIPALG